MSENSPKYSPYGRVQRPEHEHEPRVSRRTRRDDGPTWDERASAPFLSALSGYVSVRRTRGERAA